MDLGELEAVAGLPVSCVVPVVLLPPSPLQEMRVVRATVKRAIFFMMVILYRTGKIKACAA